MKLASCDRSIAAPIDEVWRLISTAEGLCEWLCETATIDLREGGAIHWRHDNGWVVAGEIREIVPMRRLAYTFGWAEGGFPVPVGSSVVTMELTGAGGLTTLSIRHTGLTDAMAEQHTGGWAMFADLLVGRVKGATT